MGKRGRQKIFLKFLYAGDNFLLLYKNAQNHKFSNENIYIFPYGGMDFKKIYSRPLFIIIFRPKMVFLDADSILRVKIMYEIVK